MGSMYSLCTVPSICSIDDRSWSWCACVGGLRPLLWPLLSVLGAYVGIPGPLLGLMLALLVLLGPVFAVLGRSWGLCWLSWAALGVCVDGPGPLLGPVGAPGWFCGQSGRVRACWQRPARPARHRKESVARTFSRPSYRKTIVFPSCL